MTKPGFKIIMIGIKDAYGGKFQELTSSVLDTWFICLSDLDEDRLKAAAARYIKNNQYPPTIADLREVYRSVPIPEPGPFDRFKNMPAGSVDVLISLGIITPDGGLDLWPVWEAGEAGKEYFKMLQEGGILRSDL